MTRGNRVPFLKLLAERLREQHEHYPEPLEWVIVDGSRSAAESDALKEFAVTLMALPFTVTVLLPDTETSLGNMRNLANAHAKGRIIACMDDDDCYQPTYVAHAVDRLEASGADVAGCGAVYAYDLRWRILCQCHDFGAAHTVAHCLVYRASYAASRSFGDRNVGEEPEFLEGLSHDSMVQLDPTKCVVHMVHGSNTFEKTGMIMATVHGYSIGLVATDANIDDLVTPATVREYECAAQAVAPRAAMTDITYYCGVISPLWDPEDRSLGGSEQAIVHLSRAWVAAGRSVTVYGGVAAPREVDGVAYRPAHQFDPAARYKVLITWRSFGTLDVLKAGRTVAADCLMVDMHDNNSEMSRQLVDAPCRRTLVMHKSAFHARECPAVCSSIRSAVIPNGVQIDSFTWHEVRDPYRVCYTSCWHRGLEDILRYAWPAIVKLEPRAELHLYYGTQYCTKEFVDKFRKLIAETTNVCDHGRQSIDLVAREKHRSTFHMYITTSSSETDCIAVRESLVAGCIPLLARAAVFEERDGVHFDPNTPWDDVAKAVVDLMHNPEACAALRAKLAKSKTIVSWPDVAAQWLECMEQPQSRQAAS